MIDWRALYAIEAQAAGGCVASPRRMAARPSMRRLWAAFPFSRSPKLLLLGLDNAGKTTMAHMLANDRLAVHPPSLYPQMAGIMIDGLRFTLHDNSYWGLRGKVTQMYEAYIPKMSGVVYLVDACDRERLEEARSQLAELMKWLEKNRPSVPLLVLGNKIDRPGAVSEKELKAALNISYCCTGKEPWQLKKGVQPMEVFMASVVKRVGYGAGFRWLEAYCS